jgi:hypothetical protein
LNQRERERFHAWITDRGLEARPRGCPPKDQSSQKTATKQPQSSHKSEALPGLALPSLAKPSQKTKAKSPAKAKPLPDPRAGEFKLAFLSAFQVANGIPAPWDAKEATNLARFLKASPSINLGQWERILYNRSQSPLNQKASLSTWVSRALAWLDAPADEWGKPLTGGVHGFVNRGQARTNSNIENARRAALAIAAQFTGDSGGGEGGGCIEGSL